MSLIELIDKRTVKVPLEAADKQGVLRELVDLLASATDKVSDPEALYRAVLDREALGSTGLSEGIAVPHGKTNAVKNVCLAIGVAPEGIGFDAADGKPSRLFFLIAASADKAGPHIAALADIARLARSGALINALVRARDASELIAILQGE
ncbi:MAG: PTS sugar transporter subunit IIA [Spirochaetia bacterium]|nr:PTS sugar transporter subunit IIA [Spirochaetia bacterium]